MNEFLNQSSKDFLYSVIEKILNKMLKSVIEESRKQIDEQFEYLDAEQIAHKYCMSLSKANNNFFKDCRMQLIEKRKPGTNRGKRYWKAGEAINICNEIMDGWE
ncbi:hypothetical protein FH947_001909 [Enterococcus faecalis]|uniref:hypothetical protein n=1 Tax=Enterococcus faecalis TaxID=1351 RepID=UPI0019F7B881|nr:hypothetical protein [Enterococcus faecalis]EGO7832341.1 hypothetical protein [Enterococcus faecalis]EGO8121911.1 hypothetical protein [Enterococcus faecalis]EKK0978264.1 hypothetical protein [Enterococcus faecalis]EKZ0164256.1 hypothetical protein [Enterococcus faecalis]EKZ0220901.1 hypothetical protein [Enterococcus faecalis]